HLLNHALLPSYYTHTLSSHFPFNATSTTQISTLSLHDALPISKSCCSQSPLPPGKLWTLSNKPRSSVLSPFPATAPRSVACLIRSEEHTSELQSPYDLVCRLLLEKKKKKNKLK